MRCVLVSEDSLGLEDLIIGIQIFRCYYKVTYMNYQISAGEALRQRISVLKTSKQLRKLRSHGKVTDHRFFWGTSYSGAFGLVLP